MSDFVIPSGSGRALQVARLASLFNLQNVQIINSKNPYEGKPELQRLKDKDAPIGQSSLGTPIYTDLTLMGCNYTDNITGNVITLPNDRFSINSGSNNGTSQQGGYYQNLDTVLITIDQPIRIIKTEIQGRNGTVKEYIGADDTRITVQGVITGGNGNYPRDEVARLKAWLDAPVAKNIVAWWLQNLGIHNAVVDSYSIPQTLGGYSYQAFTINMVSDTPVELRITTPLY